MAPPDAERMSSWISEDMVPVLGLRIILGQQRPGTHCSGLGEARLYVRDVKVQMDLLRISVWPFRRLMVWRVLHADHPLTRTIDHTVEGVILLAQDASAEQLRPERAHLVDVRCVENHDMPHQIHKIQY